MADRVLFSGVLLQRLAAHGIDVGRMLDEVGLPRSLLAPPPAHVTTGEYFAFWRAVEAAHGDPDLGLRLGSEATPEQYNVASMAALCSANLGEALERIARYKRLVCPEEVRVNIAKGEARVRFHWLLAQGGAPRLVVDGSFATTLTIARRGTQKSIVPLRIELARRRAHARMLERHFGCPVRFDAPIDVLVLPEAALAERFVTHNEELLRFLVPGLDAALEADGRSLEDDVRLALRRRMVGERPSVEKVAAELRLSSRTLQRRLEEADTSYQRLLDEVRHESALRLLARTNLDASGIAFLLGFEELNSFTRAFQSWEGTTPTRYRALGA